VNEIPLGHMNYNDFIDLVVHRNVRPERPDEEDVPQLSDAIWDLAGACWVKDPKERPTAAAVCTTLSHLLETASIPQPTPDVAPSRPSAPPLNLTIRGHTDKIWCAAFSLDRKQIVSGSEDRTIRVWDAQTGSAVLRPLKMHSSGVCSVAFSPDGRRIASGSTDKTILIWDAVTGKVVAGPLEGHAHSIWSVCFSPNGKQVASGSRDQTIRIWDAKAGDLLVGPLSGHKDGVTSVAFSVNGTHIVSGSHDMTVRVWDAMSGRLVCGPLTGHRDWVYFVAFSPDSKRIVAASHGENVCVWNTDTGTLVSGPSLQHADGALAVVFTPNDAYSAVSPDGKWIAAYADATYKSFHVWNSNTGQLAVSLDGHVDKVTSITFSPDSRRVLTASHDRTVRVHTLDC
jgi:WD40 repeat protein